MEHRAKFREAFCNILPAERAAQRQTKREQESAEVGASGDCASRKNVAVPSRISRGKATFTVVREKFENNVTVLTRKSTRASRN
jgi:hypothetical protein